MGMNSPSFDELLQEELYKFAEGSINVGAIHESPLPELGDALDKGLGAIPDGFSHIPA